MTPELPEGSLVYVSRWRVCPISPEYLVDESCGLRIRQNFLSPGPFECPFDALSLILETCMAK